MKSVILTVTSPVAVWLAVHTTPELEVVEVFDVLEVLDLVVEVVVVRVEEGV